MIDFALIWGNLPFPAFVIDENDRIAAGNSTAEQFIQTSEKQMTGKHLSWFFGESTIVLETLKQTRDQKNNIAQYGVDLATLSGTNCVCNLLVSNLNTTPEQLLMIIQPTGAAQKMSQSMTHRSAARSVTAMASMLAHEIRNPLAGISGAAQLLAMNADENDRNLSEMIDQESKRIGSIVDRFEHFSDDRPVKLNPFNIHDTLDRAIRSAAAGYASAHKVTKEYDPSLPDASGDADQLLQVFQNLLKNAAEATFNERGKIKVKTSYNSGVKFAVSGDKTVSLPLQIEISDNGNGIPQNLISEIFEPFVSTKVNGSGLGLPFVSKIVTNHGGLVECKSDAQGTTFTIRLPISKQSKGV